MAQATDAIRRFDSGMFFDQLNRINGTGGEILVKSPENARRGNDSIVEEGDVFIGLGLAHMLENISEPGGLDTFRLVLSPAKSVARALRVVDKVRAQTGVSLDLAPLEPTEFSEILATVSDGRAVVDPETIPDGTIILSYVVTDPDYTMRKIKGSPGENWYRGVRGDRHWNVGFGAKQDFWTASLPSDDLSRLTEFPSRVDVGEIRFGLSLLEGSQTAVGEFRPVEFRNARGEPTEHQFCLSGKVTGTRDWDSAFNISLRTFIVCHPTK